MMNKLSGIKVVGFDLDDTLVMTEAKAFDFENNVLSKMGRPPMSREAHQASWGIHIEEAMEHRSPGVDVKEFMRIFKDDFKRYLKSGVADELTKEVEETLKTLGERGYYLFILTGRDGFETAHIADGSHPITVHIAPEDVFHKDNLPHAKPDPRAFDWLFKKGFKPEEVVFVGDSIYDAQAATGANINFVATLESRLHEKDYFKDYPVAAFISKFSELTELIG